MDKPEITKVFITSLCVLRIDVLNVYSFYYVMKGKQKMELKDTVELMNSKDYKERFKAEYLQARIRYDKLDAMTVKYEAGTLNFTPSCPLELLKEQKKYMGNYIRTLKIRAEIEKINLNQLLPVCQVTDNINNYYVLGYNSTPLKIL